MANNGAQAHIWAYVFGHNSVIFGPIGLKILMRSQETNFYQLMIKNPSYDANFSFLTRPKRWPTRWNFWANRYSKSCYRNFQTSNFIFSIRHLPTYNSVTNPPLTSFYQSCSSTRHPLQWSSPSWEARACPQCLGVEEGDQVLCWTRYSTRKVGDIQLLTHPSTLVHLNN